jgi:hypothetical protein
MRMRRADPERTPLGGEAFYQPTRDRTADEAASDQAEGRRGDAEGRANFALAEEHKLILGEERTFLRNVVAVP